MTLSRRCAGIVLAAATWASAAAAQARPEIELGVTVSGAYPSVTIVSCCAPRTPPTFADTGERMQTLGVGGETRIYWSARGSVLGGFEIRLAVQRDFAYGPPPAPPLPLIPGAPATYVSSRSTERSGWTVLAGAAFDLATGERWRPWVGVAWALDDVTEQYSQTSVVYDNPVRTSSVSYERSEHVNNGVAAGGVRMYARRVVLSAQGGLFAPVGGHGVAHAGVRWQVGAAVRLGKRAGSEQR